MALLGSRACRLVTQPIIHGRFLEEGSLRSRSHAGEVRVFSTGRSGAVCLFRLLLGQVRFFFLLLGGLGLLTFAFCDGLFSWVVDDNFTVLTACPAAV